MAEGDDTKEIRQRLEGIASAAPNISTKDALQHLVNEDPAVFCAVNRRLRGYPLTFQATKQITDEAVKELQKVNPNNWESELKSRLLRHRPWMLKPLRDNHPHKAYEKARQVGVSELSLTEAIHFLSSRPPSERPKWVYCVPDDAEILTRRGWLKWYLVKPAVDEALVLEPSTKEHAWHVIDEIVTFDFDGDLLAVGAFHCTDVHRWPILRDDDENVEIARAHDLQSKGSSYELLRYDPVDRVMYTQSVWKNDEPRKYIGKVWCPRTKAGTWCMRYRGKIVFTGNTFPRDTQLRDFSNTRISEALKETQAMAALLTGANQIYAKQIGNGHLLLRSAWESGLGEGIDADGVTLDEKDRMKDGVDIAFRESLASSKYGYLREVSTPSLPGRGVDKPFRASDQQTWFVKCANGHKQEITYEDNIHQVRDIDLTGVKEIPPGTYDYLCRFASCRKPLDRRFGEWVAKHPDRKTIRGYHISQLMAVWISADKLMQKKLEYRFFQPWANYCLGITAKGDNMMLTELDFARIVGRGPRFPNGYARVETGRTRDWSRVSVGIDWGHQNWCTVWGVNAHNERTYLLDIGIFEDDYKDPLLSVRRIEQFLIPWSPDVIVADGGFGKDRNAYLIKKFGQDTSMQAEVYACWYNPSTKASRTFQPVWGDCRVLVDRTMTLKTVARSIKEGEFGIPSLEDIRVQLLMKHWTSLSTLLHEEEDITTGTKTMVEEIAAVGGEDHLAHSSCYGLLGLDRVSKIGRFNWLFA